MKSEKVPKIQPKISQSEQHYESFSNEQPDEIENLKSFQITDNKAKEIQTKPKESEEKIETIGNNHALKKYDQFALNTSCFWGNTRSNITPVVQFHEIFCCKNNE